MKAWTPGAALLAAALLAGCAAEADVPFRLRRLAVDPAGGGDATISPDGRRFVISSRRSGNWDLWVYDVEAEAWSRLTDDPGEDFEGKWSPDGGRLAFTSTRSGNKDVWLLRLADGGLKRLTDSPEEDEYPAWSPDGKEIVYSGGEWGNRDFYVGKAAGGKPRKITPQPGWAGACTYGAQGETLLCHRYDLGTGDVQRIDLGDGGVHVLTTGPDWDYKPAESPDGRWIAFSRSRETPSGIWLMPAAGGEARALTASAFEDRWPTWTDSGDLFFHRVAERGVALKLLDRATGEVRTVAGPGERPLQGALDPAGERAVFCAQGAGGKHLRIAALAAGRAGPRWTSRPLPTGPGEACFPRFSPDGSRIAFALRRGRRWEIAVVRPDGGGLAVLTAGVAGLRGLDGPLDWTPDGAAVLFQSDTRAFDADLFRIDVETRRLTRLTDDGWFDEAPATTPDGRGLLFMSTRGGGWTWGLYRLSLADGKAEVLAGPDYVEKNYPRMAPDGALVWTVQDEQGVDRLALRTPAGEVRTIAQAGGGVRWPSFSADGRQVLFTAMHKQVEYWLAEALWGKGSPLLAAALPEAAGAVANTFTRRAAALPADRPQIGPVDLHHR